MANEKQKALNHINKALHALPVYQDGIDLESIFHCVQAEGGLPVDEAGESWSGFLCGESGHCVIHVEGIGRNVGLYVGWYKMPSGRYEVTSYVS